MRWRFRWIVCRWKAQVVERGYYSPLRLKLVAALFLFSIAAWPSVASGQSRFVVGEREQISRLGPIKDRKVAADFGEQLTVPEEGFVEAAERARQGGVLLASVGFRYEYAVVGLPVWTWGGDYCVFLGRRSYLRIPKKRAADLLGVPEEEVQPPFSYRVPLGLIGYPLLIVVGVPVSLLLAKREAARRRRAEQVYQDSFHGRSADSVERVGSVLLRDDGASNQKNDRD